MPWWYAAILELPWWGSLYSGQEGALMSSPSFFTILPTLSTCNVTANHCAAEHRWWLPSESEQLHISGPRIALSLLFYWLQERGIIALLCDKQKQNSSGDDFTWQREGMCLAQGNEWHIKYRVETGMTERGLIQDCHGKTKLHSSKATEMVLYEIK